MQKFCVYRDKRITECFRKRERIMLEEKINEKNIKVELDTEEIKIDINVSAYISDSYIPSEIQRIEMYQKISNIETNEDMLLSDGDMLLSSEGIVLEIEAANEEVTTVVADKITLQKIIYFLGERHTFIEIKDSFIRYLPQKELDEEIRKMGGKIFYEKVKFNPEPMTLKRF